MVSVRCLSGHCGRRRFRFILFYPPLALGVALRVAGGCGFVLSYRLFDLGVGFGRSAFAAVSYFPALSFVRVVRWVWPLRFRGGFVFSYRVFRSLGVLGLTVPLSRWFRLSLCVAP